MVNGGVCRRNEIEGVVNEGRVTLHLEMLPRRCVVGFLNHGPGCGRADKKVNYDLLRNNRRPVYQWNKVFSTCLS